MFRILTIAAVLGLLSIVLGAFGAHALKEVLNAEQLESFKTGVFYQLIHVIVIFIVFSSSFFTQKQSKILGYIFLTAISLFSGSIYAIHLTSIPVKSIWWVAPLGGLLFMVGWAFMIYIFFKKSIEKTD